MTYQPKTGEPCNCRPGIQRDNCPACEGTGMRIDFRAIREAPMTGYVYTLAAAYARLRRGAKMVGIFLPGSGRIVMMTPENKRQIAALFRQQAKEAV